MSSIKEGRMHAIIWWMFHSLELVAKRVAKLLGFWIDMGPKAMDQEISWSFFRLKPWSLVEARHYSSFHQSGTKNFITFRRNQSIAIVSIAFDQLGWSSMSPNVLNMFTAVIIQWQTLGAPQQKSSHLFSCGQVEIEWPMTPPSFGPGSIQHILWGSCRQLFINITFVRPY